MASRARPTREAALARAIVPAAPAPAQTTLHALYGMEDVEAALGRGRRPFQGDPEINEGSGLDIRHAALEALLEAGEAGRWRTLAHPAGVNKRRSLTPPLTGTKSLELQAKISFGVGSRSAPIVTPPETPNSQIS